MTIGRKDKDHLKHYAGVALVSPILANKSDDPLRFWTNHPTENTLVDLHVFDDGERSNPGRGKWRGPFTGRPELTKQLAPALEARLQLLSSSSAKGHTTCLRMWWRLFDQLEKVPLPDGRQVARVVTIADLNELHANAARQNGMDRTNFRLFVSLVNDACRLIKPKPLPILRWTSPKGGEPIRNLIPEDQVRDLRTALKQGWERVRKTWARNDAIRQEAARCGAGGGTVDLSEREEHLLENWVHFQRIQEQTGRLLPTTEQIYDGRTPQYFCERRMELLVMRAILFPTEEECDIAYHLALQGSGWNPSTMARIDADNPFLVSDHPKDSAQLVLAVEEQDTIHADKPRANHKTQFFTALKKDSASPPVIVATYLKRVEPLREILKQEHAAAVEELTRLQRTGGDDKAIETQYKLVQKLGQGCRSVWLYVRKNGAVSWLNCTNFQRYTVGGRGGPKISYLDRVLGYLNARRAEVGKPKIGKVTPSDFRDIFARQVYLKTGGNIIAVMLALGHSSSTSTVAYLENNIFSAENDEHALRFMTHLFAELGQGRVDLTILAQLVRHGPLTPEMEVRLQEYRKLMRSRIGAGCADPRRPPPQVAPSHVAGRLCGTHRCLKDCPHAKFLPESLDGIAMRVEELMAMSDHVPREMWLRGEFEEELKAGEYLLDTLYEREVVAAKREMWRERIASGEHLIPGLGRITQLQEAA